MIKIKKRNILFILFLLLLFTPIALAGITGSKHDFSGEGWNASGEICKVCHTPHNSEPIDLAPLWNHEISTATYTLYSSPTLDATMEQPNGISKLCLSCHDGTVALESYGDNTGGSNYMSGPAAVGRGLDLSDDHPVSFRWEHQTLVDNCTLVCHTFEHGNPYTYPVRFYNHRVECSTCHDPHNNHPDNIKMLRLTMDGSQLCLLCHQK